MIQQSLIKVTHSIDTPRNRLENPILSPGRWLGISLVKMYTGIGIVRSRFFAVLDIDSRHVVPRTREGHYHFVGGIKVYMITLMDIVKYVFKGRRGKSKKICVLFRSIVVRN